MNGDDRWLTIDRAGDASWSLDIKHAPHLDGCAERDISATPFCNAPAIRLLGRDGALRAAHVDATDLSVQRSRQRYEKISDTHCAITTLAEPPASMLISSWITAGL